MMVEYDVWFGQTTPAGTPGVVVAPLVDARNKAALVLLRLDFEAVALPLVFSFHR